MSISGVSSSSAYSYQEPMYKIKSDFKELGTALSSGNLSDAQKVYGTLQTDSTSQSSDGNNPVANDLASLGSALQSGSLADARQSYAQMQKHLRGHGEFAKQQMQLQSSLASDDSASSQGSDSSSTSTDQLGQELQNLMAALQSGSVSDAQSAFAALQKDVSSQNGGQSDDPFSKDLQSVGSSLDSGDLQGAQEKMAQIADKMSHRPQGPPPPDQSAASEGSSALQDDLKSLSAALESGDLTGAQSAFATLQSGLSAQSADSSQATTATKQHHPRPQHSDTATEVTASTSSTSSTSTTTSASSATATETDAATKLGEAIKSALASYLQSTYRSQSLQSSAVYG